MGQIPDLRWQSRTQGRGVVRRSSEFKVERRVKVTKLPGDSEEIMVSTTLGWVVDVNYTSQDRGTASLPLNYICFLFPH